MGGGAIQRNQPTPHSQQSQHDEFFSSSSRMNTNQGAFRFGNQASMPQSAQPQPNSIDEFPPLNNSLRNADGDIGQERGSTLMSTLGFGAQGNAAGGSLQGTRAGNGLLNALSANSRTTDVRSPDGTTTLGTFHPTCIYLPYLSLFQTFPDLRICEAVVMKLARSHPDFATIPCRLTRPKIPSNSQKVEIL
jgi:hypothetical protein